MTDQTNSAFNGIAPDNLLEAIVNAAIGKGISDIHIHPEKNTMRVRWRHLGILEQIVQTPRSTHEAVARRLKFQAKMKLNLEHMPQDGHFTVTASDDQRIVNIRVASLPTRFGEAYTLRILDPKRGIVPLATLGFPAAVEQSLRRLVALPNGLLLVTGPTGSGKTTTLYALLETIADGKRNVITLEDPIEYELERVTQSQVDGEHGYSFAAGLRAILRHDPDIILVGEIRDRETAQTAIDAALTGHLVLATLHTNSAIEAIPRLLSMGVSSYTFAPALRAVLAQRLIRTINPIYRSKQANTSLSDFYAKQQVICELLVSSGAVEKAILEQASAAEIGELARKNGLISMREHGASLVREDVTTEQEVARVTAI